jgi:predicted nucleic acid-binding Zn ribbon protein
MPRKRPASKNPRRASAAQLIFLALTIVIILSFVLSLFINL